MGSIWEAGKENGVLEPVGWVASKRRRGAVGESGVREMEEAKKIEAPTLAKRFHTSKGTGQVGTTRKE